MQGARNSWARMDTAYVDDGSRVSPAQRCQYASSLPAVTREDDTENPFTSFK
jgi:hypothetical protein